MESKIVYIVQMFRDGDKDGHSYLYGVYSDRKIAEYNAQLHINFRAGKYGADVIQMLVDGHSYRSLVCHFDGDTYSDDEDLENDIKSRKDYLKYRSKVCLK